MQIEMGQQVLVASEVVALPAAPFFSALSWLVLAVAFGLVARRCWAGRRAVAITGLLTCVAALAGGVASVLVSASALQLVLSLAFLALIAFGITAHRPFGWWWSVPATVAGLLGASGTIVPAFSYLEELSYPEYFYYGWLWLVPLLILGIAMCRTRVEPPTPN